jgi:hypothetical protein
MDRGDVMAGSGSDSPRLVNPYLDAPARPAVRVVTLGRLGLVAAGVLAVAAPADASANTAAPSEEGSEFALVLGDGPEVSASVDEVCMPGGYLLPAPPVADPEGSPALIC